MNFIDPLTHPDGTKFHKFSILNTGKLSVREMKQKLSPLKNNLYSPNQDTDRPMTSEGILNKAGFDESSSQCKEDILEGSTPNIGIIIENKDTESGDSKQAPVEVSSLIFIIPQTEEEILTRKIKSAVK